MTIFAPQLYVKRVAPAMEFYEKAFDAVELRRWTNPDGSVHVAEMAIDGAMFHVHEERSDAGHASPETLNATSLLIGVFAEDPDRLFKSAMSAGGRLVNAMLDFDYGYRQGVVADPFGHQWLLQKRINATA
jgi:PhnB protein